MAVLIQDVKTVQNAIIEPIALKDVKTWLRIDYSTDDDIINLLITASRLHLEKKSNLSISNKVLECVVETSGVVPAVWMIDCPYGPVVCINSVYYKNGINSWETMTKNEDYEVIGNKVWVYSQGTYKINYSAGYGNAPEDLKNDLLTLIAWMYENRGKAMNSDQEAVMSRFPNWDGLNYHAYKTVII